MRDAKRFIHAETILTYVQREGRLEWFPGDDFSREYVRDEILIQLPERKIEYRNVRLPERMHCHWMEQYCDFDWNTK